MMGGNLQVSPDRLERLCCGECYNPADERVPIETIEIVRVRPQPPGTNASSPEALAALIDDPWRRIQCPPHGDGCAASFSDPDFPLSGSPASYYARAIQSATPAINGDNQRTEFDADGNPVWTTPCQAATRPQRMTIAWRRCVSVPGRRRSISIQSLPRTKRV